MKFRAWLAMMSLTVMFAFPLGAQNRDCDLVVFKDNVELPDFARDRLLKCTVLNSNEDEITVDISQYQGIQTIKKIPRSLIGEITLFDRAKMAYNKIKNQIQLPPNSVAAEYYNEVVKGTIQPLLEKYPDSDAAPLLTAAARELEREKKLVQLGWVRRGKVWFSPDESKGYANQGELPRFMSELKVIQQEVLQGQSKGLIGLSERISRYKNNLYYPYLLEGVQVIIKPSKGNIPPDLSLLSKQSSLRLLELSKQFQTAGDRFEEIKEQQLYGLELLTPLMDTWIAVAKGWPELDGLRDQVESGIETALNNLWLVVLQRDKTTGAYDQLTYQVKTLLDCNVLPVAKGQAIRSEMESLAKFKEQLWQWQQQGKLQEITKLTLPERVNAFAPAPKLLKSLVDDATAKMDQANQLLAASQQAYQAGNWSEAAEKASLTLKLWSDNPKAQAYYDQLIGDLSTAITKRKKNKELCDHILAVLNAGWPNVEKVKQFEQELNYSRDFLDYFDNFSLIMVGVIAFCVIVGFIALKYLGRLFSEG